MIRVPAGSVKLLLIDEETVARNKVRSATKAAPVGRVLVLDAKGNVAQVLNDNHIEVNGPVQLTYTPHALIASHRHEDLRAAYTTTAEVIVGESAAPKRAEQSPDDTKATTQRKPQKPQRITTVKTEEQ